MKTLTVCLVRHSPEGKAFLFECEELKNDIKRGSLVVCDTMRGKADGAAVTAPIDISGNEDDLRIFLKTAGAYTPIKQIVKVVKKPQRMSCRCCPLSEEEKREIALGYIRQQLSSYEIPF